MNLNETFFSFYLFHPKITIIMEKFNFIFLIRENSYWNQVFSHVENLKKSANETGNIVVIAVSSALLSCLQHTNMKTLKETIAHLSEENIQFYLCINTMSRYGINEEMLLPQITVAHEGGLLKAAKFEATGYHLITLG